MHVKNAVLVRYIIAGVVAFAIELLFLLVCRYLLDLSIGTSTSIAFWIGFVASFGLQKIFAFKNLQKSGRAVGKQLVAYSMLILINYAFTITLVHIFPENLLVIVRTIALAITTAWNYVLYRTVIFKLK